MAALEISGLAVPFDEPAWIDGVPTAFARGAFAACIARPKSSSRVALWLNHEPKLTFARRDHGDLGLHESAEGLVFTARVDDVYKAYCLRHIASARQIHGVSVSWKTSTGVAEWRQGIQVITHAELIEISLMTAMHRPAFSRTWARVFEVAA